MQYGADVFPYKRIKKSNSNKIKEQERSKRIFLKISGMFLISLLISRTMIINSTAPFGIAFLIVVLNNDDYRLTLSSAFGTIMGYITMQSYVKDISMYYVIIPSVVLLSLLLSHIDLSEKYKKIVTWAVLTIGMFSYNIIINEFGMGMAGVSTLTNLCCIFPIYFILQISDVCFKELKTKHLFKDEEVVCMAILISIVIAGTWGIKIFGVSVTNVLAFTAVLGISYISGSAVAGTVGLAMGAIIGMSNQNLLIYITVLGMVGLISGIFKEGGRAFVSLSFLVTFLIVKVYLLTSSFADVSSFALMDGILAIGIFALMPGRVYDTIGSEINSEKKRINLDRNYLNNIKNMYLNKLDNFSDVLSNMSDILSELVDNDKLLMTSKSTELVDNLAARVCGDCNANCICWNREHHLTYNAFSELIENQQKKSNRFPMELERKCLKKGALIRNSEDVVNKYIISEMWRTRLSEGRELLASQINNMAKSVDELVQEFNEELKNDGKLERDIIKLLDKNKIYYDDVFCIKDKNDRSVIRITATQYGSLQVYSNRILPIIEEAAGTNMVVNEDGCYINSNTNSCIAVFEEAPNLKVVTYMAKASKDGYTVHGDSYSFGNTSIGNYMMLVSDGMGSGPQAGRESEAAVELIEKFINAGFSKTTAINTVNSIMTLKFCEEEKFSTIDLSTIDLYSGEIDFMKVGAVASFIKSDDVVDIIKSKSLPIGVLDEVDIDTCTRKVKHGDLVVMLTDGVSDVEEAGGIGWILDYMGRHDEDVENLASGIIEEAKRLGKNKVGDDMTVLVSKVYNQYNAG
ncbi:stage II sporulation protein E [Clostridium senegalense]|uniref:stage II sporulation protein E n=1 Tax=Clostridium senegalense TaxID=1465809 RepID=UPI001C120541|nr:stage II sporulation protein E [Clostridium senegalense]MBU5226491.1 stage II sporulation protein E [Clostridium senegalense]